MWETASAQDGRTVQQVRIPERVSDVAAESSLHDGRMGMLSRRVLAHGAQSEADEPDLRPSTAELCTIRGSIKFMLRRHAICAALAYGRPAA